MIPVAKIGRKDWVKTGEKFNRYKVGIKSFFNPKAKKFVRQPFYYFIDDFGKTLSLYFFRSEGGKRHSKGIQKINNKIIISCKKGLNVYSVRNNTGQPVGTQFRNISNKPHGTYGYTSNIIKPKFSFKKSILDRESKIVQNFFHNNGLKYNKDISWHKNVFLSIYPCLKPEDLTKQISLDSSYSRYFRNKDFKKVIKGCFGNRSKVATSLTMDFYKKHQSFDILKTARLLKGLIPFDKVIQICQRKNIDDSVNSLSSIKIQDFRKLLKNYPPERVFILFNQDKKDYFINDTIHMYKEYGNRLIMLEKPANLGEIHDYFSLQVDKLINADFELATPDNVKKLDGLVIGDMTIIIPKTSYELKDWGNLMHQCVGSYGKRISKDEQIIGINKNGELTYNIDINYKQISQFRGKYNADADINDKNKIEKFLLEKKIIKKIEETEPAIPVDVLYRPAARVEQVQVDELPF